VGVAVKVTFAPEQMGLEEATIETVGVTLVVIAAVMLLLVAVDAV
jgi:hypothetical protein